MSADNSGQTDAPSWGRRVGERLLEEVRRFIFLFIYLWVQFGLFVLNGAVASRQQGLTFAFHGLAFVNALVLAKIMLIIEDLDLTRGLKNKPVALNIIFEAALCTVLLMGFHVVEHMLIGLYHRESVAASVPKMGGGGISGLSFIAVIVFISLLPFFAFKNIAKVIGYDRMQEILFRKPMADL